MPTTDVIKEELSLSFKIATGVKKHFENKGLKELIWTEQYNFMYVLRKAEIGRRKFLFYC